MHIVEELIKRNIDLEMRSTTERTVLHLAAARGHVEICKRLLDEMMIDRNCVDNELNTPLHLASEQGH